MTLVSHLDRFQPMPGAFDLPPPRSPSPAPHPPLGTSILYCSLSKTTHKLASSLTDSLKQSAPYLNPVLSSLDSLDLDQLIHSIPPSSQSSLAIFLLPSYNVESPVDSVLAQFRDALNDFRLSNDALAGFAYGVFGIGHRDYGSDFCKQAAELDRLLAGLGARRVFALASADVADDPERDLAHYAAVILDVLPAGTGSLAGLPSVAGPAPEAEADGPGSDDEFVDYSRPLTKLELARQRSKAAKLGARPADAADIEDLGVGVAQMGAGPGGTAKEMISPMTRKSLAKQGYALVGSHSAVKTCRWTKASLRGRGFCYKHAFYGIQSHQCMEATPSLACANKCTFCWRAHTNPVGTSWRWKTDSPEFVVAESLKEHDRLIKQLAGMPGVRPDRFSEARTPRHAALSLVGEPVMYPHIRKYIELLSEKRISTFLVTNAQFPDSLLSLPPVTQLYLSIDAPTKSTLHAIDRPLHRDFWERFLESIDIVSKMKTRTVFRLTLVKGENCAEVKEYAEIIRRGKPDFIEVKGVTFCGYPGSSNLTIKNSPWHDEVVAWVSALCAELRSLDDERRSSDEASAGDDGEVLGYDIAAEHAHSCCVLAAHKKYYREGKWWTWIDYDRFFEIVESGQKEVDGIEYAAPTPEFAVFGDPRAGFSPEDERWFRKQKNGGGGGGGDER